MDSLTEVLQAIVTLSSAAHDMQQLPRTRQEVTLEENSRRAQASASNPRVTPITLGAPLSEKTLHGDELGEHLETQQNSRNAQDIEANLPPSSSRQGEEELPVKYPIAPQFCRRWGKPESYVIPDFSTKLSDGLCG